MERMRWFTGRFVTSRDLTDEQRYLVGRRWLLNRLLHGEGVLCGLEVRRDERPDCAPTTVWLEPGVALDCRGRELISACRQCVTWPSSAEPGCDPPPHEERLLVIRYREQPVDPQYALLDDCSPPGAKQPTRVREHVEWRLVTREELPHCWPGERPPVHDDCDDGDGPCGPGGCIEPYCRCGGWLPLVLLTRHDGGDIHVSRPLGGRSPVASYLTKIARVNWPHGGELELGQLIERRGRLEVEFDRPLLASDGDATGINQFTFQVEFGGLERNLEFLPSADDSPALEDRTRAVFTIDRELWDPEHRPQRNRERHGAQWRSSLRGSYVIVTLRCDFILDCHGNPVDGDHLGGRLPSGNGTPGGTFRSWFAVS
jgi:hypothetical protein